MISLFLVSESKNAMLWHFYIDDQDAPLFKTCSGFPEHSGQDLGFPSEDEAPEDQPSGPVCLSRGLPAICFHLIVL